MNMKGILRPVLGRGVGRGDVDGADDDDATSLATTSTSNNNPINPIGDVAHLLSPQSDGSGKNAATLDGSTGILGCHLARVPSAASGVQDARCCCSGPSIHQQQGRKNLD